MDHPVLVMARETLGLSSLKQDAIPPQVTLTDLRSALEASYTYDAHMAPYVGVEQGGKPAETQYRLRKTVLPEIRAAGGDVKFSCAVIEFDTKDLPFTRGEKEPWEPEWLEEWSEFVDSLEWTAHYLTRHGARLIWAYSRPVGVELHVQIVTGLVNAFTAEGFNADPLKDWPRLMRLPDVVRKDYPDDETEPALIWTGQVFDPTDLPRADIEVHAAVPFDVEDYDRPTPEDAKALLWSGNNNGARSQWYHSAKKRSRGRDYSPIVFDNAPLARQGERDKRIHSLVGSACAVLYYIGSSTPQHVYGLFMESVEALDPDHEDEEKDWRDVLWRAVCVWWSAEKAKAADQKKREAEEEVKKDDLRSRVLAGMREWCKSPHLFEEDNLAWSWAMRHMIAMTRAGTYYVMQPDGYYSPSAVRKDHLLSKIRENGMDGLIPIQIVTQQGGLAWVSEKDLIASYGVTVNDTEGVLGIGGTQIRDIDSGNKILQIRLYGLRTDLKPEFNPDVDEWLQRFAGPRYEWLCNWIGHALDFSGRAICALSIQGPPSCGKKMFISGLVECTDTYQSHATDQELLSTSFAHASMKTPFLWVNEGWSLGPNKMDFVADRFRDVVGGDPRVVNLKYREPITIYNPMRVILTANNDSVVTGIFGSRDLSPQDRDALALRIAHLVVPEDCPDFLKAKGGHDWTGGWVKNDGGVKSNSTLAKHFLWLHQERSQATAPRLLVFGDMHGDLVHAMAFRSGAAPEVVKTLIQMVESIRPTPNTVIKESTGEVFVTKRSIIESQQRFTGHATLSVKRVTQSLRALQLGPDSNHAFTVRMDDGRMSPRFVWTRINLKILKHEAQAQGLEYKRIDRLYRQWRAQNPEED